MDTHKLNNDITRLQIKAQLLKDTPIEQLNLRDKQEAVCVGFLAASMQADEVMHKLEKTLAELNSRTRKSWWYRIREWLGSRL